MEDNRYLEMQENFIGLEWVLSEMELKVHELRIKDPGFDFTDATNKMNAIKKAQNYIHDTYSKLREVDKRIFEQDLINSRLMIGVINPPTKI